MKKWIILISIYIKKYNAKFFNDYNSSLLETENTVRYRLLLLLYERNFIVLHKFT